MANWTTPKTDWVATDYFNIEDYNRIVGNLLYLKDLSLKLFLAFETKGMEAEKQYFSMIYASEMNAIEDNLEAINLNTYKLNIGNKMVYAPNGATPLFSEFNRIEQAEESLFKWMYGQIAIRNHLAITLGGRKTLGKRTHYAHDEIVTHRLNWRLSTDRSIKL